MEEGEEQISLTSQLTGLKGSAATILVPETTAQGSSGVHVSTGQQKGDTDVFHGLLEFILSLDHLVFGPVSDSSFLDLHCNIIWYSMNQNTYYLSLYAYEMHMKLPVKLPLF